MKQSNPEGPPDESLYPALHVDGHGSNAAAQQFRLQKIDELEAYVRSELDSRGRLYKKYHRAVNALDSTCAALGTVCIAAGAVGAGLLASGIRFVPGLAL